MRIFDEKEIGYVREVLNSGRLGWYRAGKRSGGAAGSSRLLRNLSVPSTQSLAVLR